MDFKIVDFLFSIFPREIGIPNPLQKNSFYRREINSSRELHRYLVLMTGSNKGVYVSLYDTNVEVTIDKFVFDLDCKTNLNKALEDTIVLVERLKKKSIPCSVIFSGSKGFHVYGLLKPKKLSRDIATYYLAHLQRDLSKGIETVDAHLIGDLRRMIRVPNTMNNNHYCAPLPTNFQKMTLEEILNYSTRIRTRTLHFTRGILKSIPELVNIDFSQRISNETQSIAPQDTMSISSVPDMEILKELVRPCVFEAVTKPNPPHIVRLDLVSELMFLGFSEDQVLEIIKDLDWEDFDERATKYQIKKIFEKKLKPCSNSKLCEVLGCDTNEGYYWWSGR